MNKHLLGAAVCISIVSVSVLVGRFFVLPAIPAIPAVDHPNQVPTRITKGLSGRVVTAEYAMRTGTLTAVVEFEWDGAGSPPESIEYSVALADGPRSVRQAAVTGVIARPFSGPSRIVKSVTFPPGHVADFGNLDNVYMHVETGLENRNNNAVFVPVLKVH